MPDSFSVVVARLDSVLGWGDASEVGVMALPVVEHRHELDQVSVRCDSSLEPGRPADPGDLDPQTGPEGSMAAANADGLTFLGDLLASRRTRRSG